jgi:cytoplasmic iron level regulating protein YaaA (DUF328/UPF0246 family)
MGAPGPVLLLPPSEGKTEGGRAPTRASRFEDRLGAARREVIAGFAAAVDDPVVAAKVLGVRGDLLDRARAAMRALADGTAPVRPAAERYSGVVWEHLGPVATPERHRILVPSAVYGITTAADPVADHRGKLSSSLPGLGRLDRYWRDLVTGTIAHHARGRTVVDLLPREHAAAVDWDRLAAGAPVVRVTFALADGTGAAGHGAKAVKGRFARVLLEHGLTRAARFTWEGWRASRNGGDIVVRAPA